MMTCPRPMFSYKSVNLFSIKKRQFKTSIFVIPAVLFFIFYNNTVLFGGYKAETREIFRSKNLLTDTKNLSETQIRTSQPDEQSLRLNLVESQCRLHQDKLRIPQEKVTMLSDPEHNIGYCNIPKIATSSWYTSILCL